MNAASRAAARLAGVVVVLVGLLSGCNIGEQYFEDIDNVGKQIVDDWKKLPEVAEAEYEYRHGLDQGQVLYVDAIVRADAVSETLTDQLKEIARRDYWQGTSSMVSIHLAVYSSDDPPVEGQPYPDRAIHRGDVGIGETDELEKKYGPRPSKK